MFIAQTPTWLYENGLSIRLYNHSAEFEDSVPRLTANTKKPGWAARWSGDHALKKVSGETFFCFLQLSSNLFTA
jgi:hypothetical protein